MAINVSLEGKAAETHGAALRTSLGKIGELRRELAELADADIAGFRQFMTAYGLPKDDGAQKATRAQALAEAAIVATNVPLAAGAVVVAALHLAREVRPLVGKMIVSDVDAGVHLLGSAGLGVLLNVEANLAWLPEAQRDATTKRADEIREAIRASGATGASRAESPEH